MLTPVERETHLKMSVTVSMAGVQDYDDAMLRLKRQLAADKNDDARVVLSKDGKLIVATVSKFQFRMSLRQLQDDFFGTYDFLVQKIKAVT